MSRIILSALALFLLTAKISSANASSPAEGFWLTENGRAVINTYECKRGLCGSIHWIIDGGMKIDEKNPDPEFKGQPLCNLVILWGFNKDGDDWEDGKIYKADDGDIYNATITVKDENTLALRGYVGVPLFGKTQTWSRVNPADYSACIE